MHFFISSLKYCAVVPISKKGRWAKTGTNNNNYNNNNNNSNYNNNNIYTG